LFSEVHELTGCVMMSTVHHCASLCDATEKLRNLWTVKSRNIKDYLFTYLARKSSVKYPVKNLMYKQHIRLAMWLLA